MLFIVRMKRKKMVRAPCCEKMGLKKGSWNPEEDFILINYVNKHGHKNWRTLPTQAGLLRCGKSCRLRWINYLRPDIKRGNFSREEENLIIQMHQMLGNRWSAIAARLPGRTDNEIKNMWHTHLKKRLPHHQNADTLNTKRQPKQVNHHHDHGVMRTKTKLEEMPLNSPRSEVSSLTTNSSDTNNHCGGVNQHHHVPINNSVESLDDDFWSQVISADHNSNEITNNSSSDQDFQFSSCVYDNVNFWYDGYICQELPGF